MRLRLLLGATTLAVALGAAHAEQPTPRVVIVQPSAAQIPANLLRISIEFSTPVEGAVLPRVALLHADGRSIEEPFLQQELWSPSGKILTFMMHPGRVKSGLNARDQLGPILAAGDDVTLALDGHPIKRWKIGPADLSGPVASTWRLAPLTVASRQPLVIALDGPIDGRDADYLVIADARDRLVAGHAQLTSGESVWTFTPKMPWRADEYRLFARATLEDPSGNRLDGHFETSINSRSGPTVDAVVTFTPGPRSMSSSTERKPSESTGDVP